MHVFTHKGDDFFRWLTLAYLKSAQRHHRFERDKAQPSPFKAEMTPGHS